MDKIDENNECIDSTNENKTEESVDCRTCGILLFIGIFGSTVLIFLSHNPIIDFVGYVLILLLGFGLGAYVDECKPRITEQMIISSITLFLIIMGIFIVVVCL